MNFSNLKPLVQDSFNMFYEYDARKEAEELISTLSSGKVAAGFLFIPSMPSLIQFKIQKVTAYST